MSHTPRTDEQRRLLSVLPIAEVAFNAMAGHAEQLETELAATKELIEQCAHQPRGNMPTDWWSVAMDLRRKLLAEKKRADESIRRLTYMHGAHADSIQWYQNAVAQSLKSLDALPKKLEF